MSTLLYQQSNVEFFWNDAEKWLYVKWTGPQSPSEVQRDCEQMLRFLAAKNANSVLNDNSAPDAAWSGVTEWISKEWFPRMRQAGLRYFAWVHSESRVSPVASDTTLDLFAPGTVKHFSTVQEAANWLRIQRKRDSARTQRIVLPPNLGRR